MQERDGFEIDERFHADHQLSDGTEVLIRTLRPADRDLLAEGFEELSHTSRYQRFLSVKSSLSESELEYLVDVDDYDHMALGAVTERGDGSAGDKLYQGLGLARFVRYEEEPEVAEVAVAVVDTYQGKGLGRLLLSYLVTAARERGVKAFRADCFSTNLAMRALFDEIGPTEVLERAGPVITLDIPLADSLDHGRESRMR